MRDEPPLEQPSYSDRRDLPDDPPYDGPGFDPVDDADLGSTHRWPLERGL